MKKFVLRICTAILLAFSLLFGASILTPVDSQSPFLTNVYADEEDTPDAPSEDDSTPEETPDGEEPSEESEETPDTDEEEEIYEEVNSCKDQTGSLAWIVCPGTGVIARAVDGLYGAVSNMLIVAPLSTESDSPIYFIWQYARDITNIIFVIFVVIVILSQITGVGLNNYGIKRVLPRIIIAVILVNLSFIICTVAVDASNILGSGMRSYLESIQTRIIENGGSTGAANLSVADLLEVVITGGAIGGIAISAIGGAGYIFFMLLTVLIGALIAVVTGLITISARHALISLLVMISPLAFVAYLLPNTEKWFNKWKDLLFRMLVFYPIFSFLFGASQLIGWTLIASATSAFGIILGIAVEIFPLFFSWSLMKMSGTVLGQLNSGLRRIAAPVQKGLTGWSTHHAEHQRQVHLANSHSAGAHLREYLDNRRELRELDTHNAMDIRHGRATEYAYKVASSNRGLDQYGNMVWDERANRYTRNAKRANTYGTRSRTAQSSYATTMASYGTKFTSDQADIEINAAGSFAGSNAMAQQFLVANQAESDQKDLLNLYLDAYKDKDTGSYQFNRLYQNAAGSLGHNGVSSIIGQVIATSSEIENRRRKEATIIKNKFNINKREFRAMSFNKAHMNDDGYEMNEHGVVIEDDNFNILPGYTHQDWPKYIGEHKVTKKPISKEEYDALSETERAKYDKIRYMDVYDDKRNIVATIYEDDAGYMKEVLRDDIAIGDPINARYITAIGVAAHDGEQTGILRRYHSTISTALNETKYKEHNAAFTPMLTQHANNGHITSTPQANIASLQSLVVASKAGQILVNDPYAIDTWSKLICSVDEQLFRQLYPDVPTYDANGNRVTAFEHYFPDQDILNYDDVNGIPLGGLRLVTDENGNLSWEKVKPSEVNRLDPDNRLKLRKNFIKHELLPKAANKIIDSADRTPSPKISEEQKGPTKEALLKIITGIGELNKRNTDESIPFEDRIKGNADLLDVKNPNRALIELINRYRKDVAADEAANMPGAFDDDQDSDDTTPDLSTREGIERMYERLNRAQDALDAKNLRNDHQNIIDYISGLVINGINYDSVARSVIDKFTETESLVDLLPNCEEIIEDHDSTRPKSTEEGMNQIAFHDILDDERIKNMIDDIIDLIENNHFYTPE